jgi:hypothetical protein
MRSGVLSGANSLPQLTSNWLRLLYMTLDHAFKTTGGRLRGRWGRGVSRGVAAHASCARRMGAPDDAPAMKTHYQQRVRVR